MEGSIIPEFGESFLIGLRVQGAQRGYYAGFTAKNTVSLIKRIKGRDTILKSREYKWEYGNEYKFVFIADENIIDFNINDENLFNLQDEELSYGMVSYAMHGSGRALFGNMHIKEVE